MEDVFLLSSPVKDLSPLASIGGSPLVDGSVVSVKKSALPSSPSSSSSSSSSRKALRFGEDWRAPWDATVGMIGPHDERIEGTAAAHQEGEEEELVTQLLWVLLGFGGTLVNGAGACVAAVGTVRAAAAQRIVEVALSYVDVVRHVEVWRVSGSKMLGALAFAVHTQLQDYRYAVQSMDGVHNGPQGPLTLPQLVFHVDALVAQIQALGRVCDALQGEINAATALNVLYRLYQQAVDPVEQRALQAMLNSTFGPYAHLLDTWMDTGVLPDDGDDLCLTRDGVAVPSQRVLFVEPVLHHILAAGRYANALAVEVEPVALPFDVARVDLWHAAVRSKCSAMASQVSARLRDARLYEFLSAVHGICVEMKCSGQMEVAMRGILEASVLDAPPLHALEKRVADVCGFPHLRVSLTASNDPNVSTRQVLVVRPVAEHPLSIVVTQPLCEAYGALFVSGHRLVYLRMAIASLFVEVRRAFRTSCASLSFVRAALSLLGALIENRAFCASQALSALGATLRSQSVEQIIAAHSVYMDRCVQSSLGGQEAYELCLDTVEAFHIYARRVFSATGAGAKEKLAGMQAKADAMMQVLQAASLELTRHVVVLASKHKDLEPLLSELQSMHRSIQ